MAGADNYFRGETLDILFDVLDEDLLDEVFEDDIKNIITEVNITYIYVSTSTSGYYLTMVDVAS